MLVLLKVPPLSSLSASCCEVDCQGPVKEHWARWHTLGWGPLLPPSQPDPGAGFHHQGPPHHHPLHSLTQRWFPLRLRQKEANYKDIQIRTINSVVVNSYVTQPVSRNYVPHWHSSSWPSIRLTGPWSWHQPWPTASCHPIVTHAEAWGLVRWIQAPYIHRNQKLPGFERKNNLKYWQ